MSRVRVGLIGCGSMARAHIRQLLDVPEAEIVALTDCDPAQIERTRSAFPRLSDLNVYEDYREMLAAEDLDAVEINTPHAQHFDQVVKSLDVGLHVLCEKPLATTSADALTLINKLAVSGKVGAIGYQRHATPVYQFIRNKIRSGELGKVTYMSALLCQDWKRLTSGTWRQDPALSGGGQLGDSGSHIVDVLLWVSGLAPQVVTSVQDSRGTPVDIDSAVTVKFEGGAIGVLSIVGDFPMWHEDLTIACEKGGFLLRGGKLLVVSADGTKMIADHIPGGTNPDANFIQAILGREEVLAPFSCGYDVMLLTEAAWKSASEGGAPVSVAELNRPLN